MSVYVMTEPLNYSIRERLDRVARVVHEQLLQTPVLTTQSYPPHVAGE